MSKILGTSFTIIFKNFQLGYFNKEKSGTITSVIINDVEQLQGALSVAFQKLFVEPINILTFAALLFIISWKLALIAIIIIPLAGIAIIAIGKVFVENPDVPKKNCSNYANT